MRKPLSKRALVELHESLCFQRAYPDDPETLAKAERALASFAERRDLVRHREALRDSGIAGTPIYYRFFWPMARWLAERWPDRLRLEKVENEAALKAVLPLLVDYARAAGIKRCSDDSLAILDRIRGEQTDATFLLNGLGSMPGDDFTREALHDLIDSEYRLDPGERPSRTHAKHDTGVPIVYRRPLRRERPDLTAELKRPPLQVRDVSLREGRQLIDLACEAMVTRSRDLEVFLYGDPRDVRIAIDRDGLAFAVIGFAPERRLLFRAGYGLLTLQNGVPIGYVQADALFESAEIAFNTFDTFRGGESAWIFARMLATVRHLLGAPSFSIEPYQLGHDNEEGLESGAWWFYYKLGFRPSDPSIRKLVAGELARMKRDPDHRSNRRMLEKLASRHLYFNLDPARQPVEADLIRLEWPKASAEEAADRLGMRSWNARTKGERLAIERWSPILMTLKDLSRWTPTERRQLAVVVRAKGGKRESDYVRLFDAHPRLRRALASLPTAKSSRVCP